MPQIRTSESACCSRPVKAEEKSLTPPEIITTSSRLEFRHQLDHLQARWGYRRGDHRVTPGLYALGKPTPKSPVLVTANYSLSFDALRSALPGVDAYLLVLDTHGVNVWCAAGKGTFGTEELLRRIEATRLREVVSHRKLILPQLGAPGVAAHEIKRQAAFKVEYGPVRAADLPAYLATGKATPEMRRVRFPILDRLTLVPMELVHVLLPTAAAALLLGLLAGPLAALAAVLAVVAGTILFPLLLPWLPTQDFSSKGFILGGLVALPLALAAWQATGPALWQQAGQPLAYLLAMPPVTAYLALNFTGSTPLTSPTSVKREIYTYIPPMAWTFGSGMVLLLILSLVTRLA